MPAHRHWRSLAAPALSGSKATPCPRGGEGQGGEGAGGIAVEGTAGRSQLGTGTQMVLPESCSSDQQVMGKERGLQGEEQPRLHRENTLFSTSKEKGGGEKTRNTSRNTGQVQHNPGTLGLSR